MPKKKTINPVIKRQVSGWVPPGIHSFLQETYAREGAHSLSDLVAQILKEYVERKKAEKGE